MKKLKKIIVASLIMFTTNINANNRVEDGGSLDVGNGGDTLVCRGNNDSQLFDWQDVGYYSLDYAHELYYRNRNELAFNNDRDLTRLNITPSVGNFSDDLAQWFLRDGAITQKINIVDQKILTNMKSKHPKLYISLLEFHQSKLNINNPQKNRIWKHKINETNFDIQDELIVNYPENCKKEQTFTRKKELGKTVYYFDVLIFWTLQSVPLQESFMLTHEWLWDFAKDAKQIRDINWFLHSKASFIMSSEEYQQKLKSLGIQ